MRKVLISVAALLILVFVGSCCTLPKGPSPTSYKDLGSQYSVKILRDNWGVPHIYGKTDPDTAFGLAYAHAEDDFQTIMESLLTCRGEMASYAGKDHAPVDFLAKLLRIENTVEKGYPDIPEDVRLLCEAYADGINFYVSQNPKVIPKRYLPVPGKDIVAGFVFKGPFFFGLDNEAKKIFEDERARPVSQKDAGAKTATVMDAWMQKNGMTVGSKPLPLHPTVPPMEAPISISIPINLGMALSRGTKHISIAKKAGIALEGFFPVRQSFLWGIMRIWAGDTP